MEALGMEQPQTVELLSVPEAARRVGVGLRQLKRGIDSGQLPVYDVGGWPRVRWREVLTWIETRRRAELAAEDLERLDAELET